MKKVVLIVFRLKILLLLASCEQSLDTAQYLRVRMIGVLTAPEAATGSYDPISQTYELEGVFLTPETGDSLSLYTEPEAKEVKIINRSQIIFETKVTEDYVGTNFSALAVRFSSTVLGASRYEEEHNLEMEDTDIIYSETFTFETGRGVSAVIDVNWKNTVTRDETTEPPTETMEVPTYTMTIESEGS